MVIKTSLKVLKIKLGEKKKIAFSSLQMFGDDKDRALIKSNGELTYFMTDIIYHQIK